MSETSSTPVAIVLAAGKSTRMKSETPKVLHDLHGRHMIDYVLDAVRGAGVTSIVVVVGHKAEVVRGALEHHPDVFFALQAEQHGTGHAVMVCKEALAGRTGPVFVLAGDTPLLKSDSLAGLLKAQQENNAACVVGTAVTENNTGLGRIVRDEQGVFLRIVEEKDANEDEKAITEINTGCYVFDCQAMFRALDHLKPENAQSEYYLTDCCEILLREGQTVVAANTLDISEAMGVNTQEQLAQVAEIMKSSR